jgi:endonuclease G, mitochondrial
MVRRLDPVWGDDAEQANDDTHVYTNACPQVQKFNAGIWNDLEDYALLDRAAERKVSVLTGPILDTDDPELYQVQIPVRFWKIIAFRKSGQLTAAAFVLSQEKYLESSRWVTHQWTLSRLETVLSLDFGPLRTADPEAALEGPSQPRKLHDLDDVHF